MSGMSVALSFALACALVAIIYGGAGVSKTTTAKRFADAQRPDEESRIYFATASKWARSSTAILQEIAAAIDPYLAARSYRNDSLARGILRKLGPGDLLVIDEGQHLDSDALDGIRFFHDEAEIGIAYLGNLEVWSRISGKGRRAAFAQLHSRVGMRLQILAPQQTHAQAINTRRHGVVKASEGALVTACDPSEQHHQLCFPDHDGTPCKYIPIRYGSGCGLDAAEKCFFSLHLKIPAAT